jgi:hypothetical protein
MTSLRGRSYTREPGNLDPTVVLIVRGGLENAQSIHYQYFVQVGKMRHNAAHQQCGGELLSTGGTQGPHTS